MRDFIIYQPNQTSDQRHLNQGEKQNSAVNQGKTGPR